MHIIRKTSCGGTYMQDAERLVAFDLAKAKNTKIGRHIYRLIFFTNV